TNCPPSQPNRVQSFGTEVAATGVAPVGLQVASPGALTWNALKPGTYLIESGTHPSIQGPMGLYGVLVVTQAPAAGPTPGIAYTSAGVPINYDSELPLVLSEIDPVQNGAVATAVGTTGFSETMVWSGQPGGCGNPASATYQQCYPPAVNYDPRYFLINGVSFDQSASGKSQFATTPSGAAGSILVRFVNAGLRMHVPSIVGAQTGSPAVAGVSLIAEDGNALPGVFKVQSEVFLAAGKTQDVLVNDPATYTPTALSALAVFDRHLSLTTNTRRGGGMMANIARTAGSAAAPVAPTAVNESYFCSAGQTLTVTDPSKGVLRAYSGVNGAVLGTQTLPARSTLTFNADGTFVYTPPASGDCTASFTFLVNGLTTATANIRRCDSGGGNGANGCSVGSAPVAANIQFFSSVNSRYASSPPGVLKGATDPNGLA